MDMCIVFHGNVDKFMDYFKVIPKVEGKEMLGFYIVDKVFSSKIIMLTQSRVNREKCNVNFSAPYSFYLTLKIPFHNVLLFLRILLPVPPVEVSCKENPCSIHLNKE